MRGSQERSAAAIAAALVFAILAAIGVSPASNEGFYLPRRIYPQSQRPIGWNLVALPARSPYQGPGGLTRLCKDLKLDPEGQIIQFDGAGMVFAHVCSMAAPQFNLLDGRGVLIQNPRLRDGVIVGSDNPTKTIAIAKLGAAPVGTNIFPIDYHTTLVTPEDLCLTCGLSATATVSRIDAQTGTVFTHLCGQAPGWNLVQGEAVLVFENQGPKTCSPPHL